MADTYNDHLITELKQYGSVKHRHFCLSGTTEEMKGQAEDEEDRELYSGRRKISVSQRAKDKQLNTN